MNVSDRPKKAPTKKPARGRLTPMRVSARFREYVVDQLSGIPGIRDRAMFGGVGLYAGDVFFGLIAADVLYFKVDDSNRQDYASAGYGPFKPYPDRVMTMPYYPVPVAILEDAPTVAQWAARAVRVAIASKKPAKKRSKTR